MGYYLSLAKVYASQGRKDLEKRNIVLSVVVPTILHGIYDFCLFVDIDAILLVFFVFVIALYVFSIKKIKLLAAQCKVSPRPVVYNNMQPQYQGAYQQQPMPQYQQQPNGYVQQQPNGYVQQPQPMPQYQQQPNGYVTPEVQQPQNHFCPECGAAVNAPFCPNCGKKQG